VRCAKAGATAHTMRNERILVLRTKNLLLQFPPNRRSKQG
jgi:hypothetical protein